MLSRERQRELQELAGRAWEELEWTDYGLGVHSPVLPVSINKILTNYGFPARRVACKPGIAGVIYRGEIWVDLQDESCHQRQTAALALGYLLLDRETNQKILYRAPNLADIRYQEALYFARQVLMPEMYLAACLLDTKCCFWPRLSPLIDEVQMVYNVPYSLAKKRIEELS